MASARLVRTAKAATIGPAPRAAASSSARSLFLSGRRSRVRLPHGQAGIEDTLEEVDLLFFGPPVTPNFFFAGSVGNLNILILNHSGRFGA